MDGWGREGGSKAGGIMRGARGGRRGQEGVVGGKEGRKEREYIFKFSLSIRSSHC
jgi:hypothetical protein